ncbi:hypothetical protein NUV26_21070 [Burkholderia pseudomultivorans]|uniref:hypothetical protein n=1 Tax=Burkholderia pseudomultivorans TaxID=1207504 RepID=UPI0028747A12|nr:hypothetical protein [Burkholderia pseudomultivorans]MDS0794663.1 hypothetical protein [Burkholderia pseudomultivorans]
MTRFFAVFVMVLVAGCSKEASTARVERPAPPHFVADGNAPTAAVAVDFINKYVAVTQAAIDRTPYGLKDSAEQMRVAQDLYKADGEHLEQWATAGVALFQAARDNTCEMFVRARYLAWKQAYPLNGQPLQRDLDKKRDLADQSARLRENCLHHTSLPVWGS